MNKTVQIILGVFIVLLILMLASSFEMIAMTKLSFLPSGLASQLTILVLSVISIYFFNKKGIIKFNIGKVGMRQIITPILLIIFLFIISELIFLKILGNINEEHFASSMPMLQIIFIVVILASISEELLFRGFLQNMLEPLKSFGIRFQKIKISLPVIISGLLFGLMHFGLITTGASFGFALKLVLFAMIMGMIAGYYQEKHNNFSFAVIVHMTANITGLLYSTLIN
ncbi:MAG: CPBP family intramembrane metalloprotease [Chlorobi bacterium]|nr:CPBP family intramembrane metalloprotease [Chlorobiota bacterium]